MSHTIRFTKRNNIARLMTKMDVLFSIPVNMYQYIRFTKLQRIARVMTKIDDFIVARQYLSKHSDHIDIDMSLFRYYVYGSRQSTSAE